MVTSMYLVLFVVGRPVWQFNNTAIHSIRDFSEASISTLPWTHMQHAILQREPIKFSIFLTRRYSIFSVKFSFLQLIFSGCVATVKCRPVLSHCVILFLVLRDHGLYLFVWKCSSAHSLGGVSGVASFITINEQHKKRGCYFPNADCASWELSLFPIDIMLIDACCCHLITNNCVRGAVEGTNSN